MLMLISYSLIFGINSYAGFVRDWNKQLTIIDYAKKSDCIRSATLILIDDNTTNQNAIKRTTRFYEWNGLLAYALGNENRFAVESSERSAILEGMYDLYFKPTYKAAGVNKADLSNACEVTISNTKRTHGLITSHRIEITTNKVTISLG